MRIRELMTPDPVALAADAPVREALELLENGTHRHLPVLDGTRVVGMLSDRDVRPWRQALMDLREGEGGSMAEEVLRRPVRAFMQTDVLFLASDRPVTDVIDVMLDFRVGAVPIVDDGRLVGIVSYVDLLDLLKRTLHPPAL
ncbi:MAG: CBS domain-containing protein [Myxococcales bacterium]|nr:CBS domain-containing protein [Myxococcales bacterium]